MDVTHASKAHSLDAPVGQTQSSGYNRALTAVSIVIPAYNEEERLLSTLEAVLKYLSKKQDLNAEVLVVNDGSSDSTHDIAQSFAGRDVTVRVIDNPGNRGKGYSVRHGVMESSGEWILFSDADLSAPIEEFDKLLWEARRQDADVAIGSRAVDRSLIGVHQSAFRENAGRIFNLLMRVVTGLPFSDTQCGFKLFSKKAAREVFSRQQIERFGFDAEVLFIARQRGFKTIEVPVRWNHVEGTKVSMFADSLNMFLDLVRIRANQIKGLYR
jgi:glycosyltransferase involved in cell wall biosynthesis